MTGLGKTSNAYCRLIDPKLYAKMPKAVLGAVAVSLAAQLSGEAENFLFADGGSGARATGALHDEWECLFAASIVPQKPVKS